MVDFNKTPSNKNPDLLKYETQWTDVSNAKMFSEMFKNRICYCKDLGGWFVYNGKIWERDKNNEIKNHAVMVYERLRKHLKDFAGNQSVKEHLKDSEGDQFVSEYLKDSKGDQFAFEAYARHVKASGSDGKLNAMVNRAEAFMGIPQERFDADPYLFNCNNGTINLRTMEMQPFNPDNMLTKISSVDYIPGSPCPLWEKFLDDTFLSNENLIEFVRRVAGYSLTSSIDEHCMFILYGTGRNGKTTFTETLSKISGMYSIGLPPESIMQKKNNNVPNDIARLKGARRVVVSESQENVTLDESLIKRLTGGDLITARFLNKEFFDFYPVFKLFLYTNKKPNIRGTDPGIWSRIRMIPFNFKVPEEDKDRDLMAKLENELPGILLWALEGCRQWQVSGLQTPSEVLEATNIYQFEEDDVGQFIEDHCVIEEKGYIPIEVFKNKFRQTSGYYKSQKIMAEYMRRKGYVKIDNRIYLPNGDRVRAYTGIRLKDVYTTTDMTDSKPQEQPREQKEMQWDE